MNADKFIYACQQDPSILRSLFELIGDHIERSMLNGAIEDNKREIYRYQGEIRGAKKFREQLTKVVRLKDAGSEQQRVRAIK